MKYLKAKKNMIIDFWCFGRHLYVSVNNGYTS